jgi:hypothetical protein
MGCPQSYCQEVVPAINLIDLFDKGLPPINGGALDQSAWFLDAVRVLHADEQEIKAELQAR